AQAPDWQRREAMTNVFLLGCALLNGVDDYLRGKTLRLPRRLVALAAVRLLRWTIEKLVAAVRWRRRARARHWRARWQAPFADFLTHLVAGTEPEAKTLADLAARLTAGSSFGLPAALQRECIYFPSAFRRL